MAISYSKTKKSLEGTVLRPAIRTISHINTRKPDDVASWGQSVKEKVKVETLCECRVRWFHRHQGKIGSIPGNNR